MALGRGADARSAAPTQVVGKRVTTILDDPDVVGDLSRPSSRDVVARVRRDTSLRSEAAWERAKHVEGEDAPYALYRRLRRELVNAEREALATITAEGTFPTRVLQQAQGILDVEETRLAGLSGD